MKQQTKLPSGPIKTIEGKCMYLNGNDIDTDRIIPARFLKCINFEALGEQVFADDRKEKEGKHPFDSLAYRDSSILIVNKNFGCGSSREHAPQALMRWGIRAIIGQSFAEIFYGNCLSIGIPCASISDSVLDLLVHKIHEDSGKLYNLDLQNETLKSENQSYTLSIEQASLNMLLSGKWDATSMLMQNKEKISRTKSKIPYLNNFHYTK